MKLQQCCFLSVLQQPVGEIKLDTHFMTHRPGACRLGHKHVPITGHAALLYNITAPAYVFILQMFKILEAGVALGGLKGLIATPTDPKATSILA